MGQIIKRHLRLSLPKGQSAFLWGPRRVGKSYWLKNSFLKNRLLKNSKKKLIDLLKTDIFFEYARRPALLRERWRGELTVIDEIQKIPALLNEVHWLIENKSATFLLTGSSARRLRAKSTHLLAGRAWRFEMTPLSFYETKGFDLERALNTGLLPPHFLSHEPLRDLRAYVSDYLKEEISAESITRNIPAFSEFLRVSALTNAELLNYTNIAREAGVSAKAVRGYFEILEDTFLACRLPPYRLSQKRRMILTEKFYFFDVGVANFLAGRKPAFGNEAFGKSFEHYIFMELMSYKKYEEPELNISFWRTAGGHEVDFICGDMHTAIEVKSSTRIHSGHLKSLKALREEKKAKNLIVVCREREQRTQDKNIHIWPWRVFLKKLWKEGLLKN